jgi:hypothetical protein
VVPKNHTRTIFPPATRQSHFYHPEPTAFARGNLRRRLSTGDQIMWILLYIATMASLSAMGLVGAETDEERFPHSDL